jgi:flagellum-specific peptidoglycan hydrolase FlgJ
MHAQAHQDAAQAFEDVVHVPPSTNELRILEAVALHETTFGKGWRSPGATSNNMGALQADANWTGETFDYSDTHPTDTGGAVAYAQKFRAYPSALEGWKDLVRELFIRRSSVRRAAQSGSPLDVASAMRATKYYEGQGATQADRIRNYAQALADSLLEIDTVGQVQR